MLGPPVLVEIAGRCADHPAHLSHLDRLLVGLVQMTDAHGHIDAFIGHVDHSIDQQRVDIHQGKLLQIRAQHRGHIQLTEQHRRGHRELAARDRVTARRRVLGLLQLGKNASAIVQVTLARFRQVQAAGGARQQLGADACFHGGDGPGHAGRRGVQAPRGGGKTLLLGHRDEHLHFMESVHRRAS